MTKFIAICDATEIVRKDRFAVRIIDHLETYFGTVKRLERGQIIEINDKRSQAVYTLASSIVATSADKLLGAQKSFCKKSRLSRDIVTTLINDRRFFDLCDTTEANYNCPDTSHDFIVLDRGIENALLLEASLVPLSDVIIVLDEYVYQDAQLLEFTCAAIEHLQNCRLSFVVYSATHNTTADIFCQFEALISQSHPEDLFFLGQLPKYKKGQKNNICEINALHNIALSLLKLNFQTIPHNVTIKTSKRSWH